MSSEHDERPTRKRRERARVIRLSDDELHHPLHEPYVRKKDWKKDVTKEGDDEVDSE